METSIELYSLKHSNVKVYLFALLFVAGSTALPQLCHLVSYSGPTLLPTYFFTLITACKCGFLVGLLTATPSPIINHLLFATSPEVVLPILLTKSSLLAGAPALTVHTIKSVSPLAILGVVFTYQVIGATFKRAIVGSLYEAVQDLHIDTPGTLLQRLGGYALLKVIVKF